MKSKDSGPPKIISLRHQKSIIFFQHGSSGSLFVTISRQFGIFFNRFPLKSHDCRDISRARASKRSKFINCLVYIGLGEGAEKARENSSNSSGLSRMKSDETEQLDAIGTGKARRFREIPRRCKLVLNMPACKTVRTASGEADPFAAQLGLLPGGVFLAYRSGADVQLVQLHANLQF